MKVSWNQIRYRMTGISTPFGGISWTPPESEREKIRGLVTFLEDRRALYMDYRSEMVQSVKSSVHQIRSELTRTLSVLDEGSKAVEPIRVMRASCREFLTRTQHITDSSLHRNHSFGPWDELDLGSSAFFEQLGRLRGVFGFQLGQLCLTYRPEIEEELAGTLPGPDEDANI